jgi:hypothetical protein
MNMEQLQQPIVQNTNILENFYSDNVFFYTNSTTINLFPDIVNHCQKTIPTYSPNYTNSLENKIAFNNTSIYEINFYKNIITIFPVSLLHYETFENELNHLITYLESYIKQKDGKINNLLSLIQHKLFIYSPYKITFTSPLINCNIFNNIYQTCLGVKLIAPMFECKPITIPINNSITNTFVVPPFNFITSNSNLNLGTSKMIF